MVTISAAQAASAPDRALAERLAAIVGAEHVLTGFPDLLAYARDRLPYATFAVRAGDLPATLPRMVVRPADEAQIAELLRLAQAEDIAVIPYGAGSGVLGGALPLGGEVMLDLKRLSRMVEVDEVNGLATVQTGLNGAQFEALLNARGYTCGHLPQSLHMSTVGGWAACRGAGQASTRYGKIEDIVVGLRAVLPDGRPMAVRPVARRSVGPSVRDMLVGSEGTLGIITEVTLRIWRMPELVLPVVLAFPNTGSALEAARRIMQSELRPAVVRVYDENESESRRGDDPTFATRPILSIFEFCGPARIADAECSLAMEICESLGGVRVGNGPYDHWKAHRYESYSPKWQSGGHSMDTIEICGPWSRLTEMYASMSKAARTIHPDIHFGAHWSHVYPEGACQYMTIRLPPLPRDEATRLHRAAWDAIERLALELGGSIAHHHGVGVFRNAWLREELGPGLDMIQGIKDAVDPRNVLNPRKLALRARPGAMMLGEAD